MTSSSREASLGSPPSRNLRGQVSMMWLRCLQWGTTVTYRWRHDPISVHVCGQSSAARHQSIETWPCGPTHGTLQRVQIGCGEVFPPGTAFTPWPLPAVQDKDVSHCFAMVRWSRTKPRQKSPIAFEQLAGTAFSRLAFARQPVLGPGWVWLIFWLEAAAGGSSWLEQQLRHVAGLLGLLELSMQISRRERLCVLMGVPHLPGHIAWESAYFWGSLLWCAWHDSIQNPAYECENCSTTLGHSIQQLKTLMLGRIFAVWEHQHPMWFQPIFLSEQPD